MPSASLSPMARNASINSRMCCSDRALRRCGRFIVIVANSPDRSTRTCSKPITASSHKPQPTSAEATCRPRTGCVQGGCTHVSPASSVSADAELDRNANSADAHHHLQQPAGNPANERRAGPATEEEPGRKRADGRPVNVAKHGERHRRDRVRKPGYDVFHGVRPWHRFGEHGGKHREQEDAAGSPEVPDVHRDTEQSHEEHAAVLAPPPVIVPPPGVRPPPGSVRPRPGSQGASSISEAAPISTGATRSNASGGVASSNAAPAPPPTAATGPRRRILAAWPASSGREPMVAPAPVNSSATVFVMFALNGGRPNASSAGYDTTEARLTTVLTIPATAPTATSPTAQATVTAPVPANSSCLQAPANSASSQAPVNPPCSQAPAGFRSPALPGRSRSFPVSSPGSFQQPQQPPRPGHLGTARQTSPPQFPVSRDHNAAAGEIMRQRGDLVIPAARGRDDPHPPILHHSLCRQPCLALDNEDEVREPRLTNHCVPARRGVVPRKARHATRRQPHQFLVEPHHGPGPVTPPAVGARSHDIGPVYDYRNLLPGTSGALLLRVRHPR